MLQVSLFSHFRAEQDGEPLRLTAATAVLPLWAYLLLHRHEPLPRLHVASILWPDASEAEALARLRRQAYLLRHSLPSAPADRPWLMADRGTVQWNREADYWLDVEEFEALCAAGEASAAAPVSGKGNRPDRADLERAVALYAGDLLIDLYDDWVLAARERVGQMYAQALTRLLGLQATDGDLHAAVATAELLLRHDNLREEAHRLVVGLRYLASDRAAALRAFRDCRNELAAELGVEPLPATARLAEAIRLSAPADEILRLLQPDLPQALSLAAASAGHVPNNLRLPVTSFIGRERELAAVERLLGSSRLLTLSGPPGGGKSRLALALASRLLARGERGVGAAETSAARTERQPGAADSLPFPDGVWCVDLAPLDEPALVPAVVAKALGVCESSDRTLIESVEQHVRPRSMLLVLDNVEHVVAACANLVARLLAAGPGLQVMATSREVLGVVGERVWAVPPLSMPPDAARTTAQEALCHDAPRLLLDRARCGAPDFALTDDNAAAVAVVCRQLDGNPLAIELAAARVRDLPVAAIAERVGDRFRLLGRAGHGTEPRHRSLGAAIDWSHDLLGAAEQTLFRRLGVFRDGWSLAAAEAVCSGAGLQPAEVLDLLASLVDKSLVDVRSWQGSRRYRMLTSLRHYARDRLAAAGEAQVWRQRHFAFYLDLAQAAGSHLTSEDQVAWLDRLELEHGNVRAALEWAADQPAAPEPAARLAIAMWRFWSIHCHFTEGRAWLERLASAVRDCPQRELEARVVYCAGSLARAQGDANTAETHACRALAMFRQLGDAEGESWALNDLGTIAAYRQDYDQAIVLFEASLAVKRALGCWWDVARTLVNLGEIAWRRGDYDRAEELYRESLTVGETSATPPDKELLAAVHNNLGELARCRGDLDAAADLYRRGLTLWCEVGDHFNVTLALAGLGGVAAGQGHPRRAARLLAAAAAQRETMGVQLDADNEAEHLRMVAAARAQLSEADWAAAVAAGRALSVAEAVGEAVGEASGEAGAPQP